MKPKNFPARKLARQIAARCRAGARATDAWASVTLGTGGLDVARAVRTKKSRGASR